MTTFPNSKFTGNSEDSQTIKTKHLHHLLLLTGTFTVLKSPLPHHFQTPWRIKPALLKTAEFICCLESNLFGICLYCISHILVGASVRSLRFDLCLVVLIKEVMEDGFLFRSVTMGTLQATLFSACVFFKQSE